MNKTQVENIFSNPIQFVIPDPTASSPVACVVARRRNEQVAIEEEEEEVRTSSATTTTSFWQNMWGREGREGDFYFTMAEEVREVRWEEEEEGLLIWMGSWMGLFSSSFLPSSFLFSAFYRL